MQIFVRTLECKTITIDIEPTDSIQRLKELIGIKLCTPLHQDPARLFQNENLALSYQGKRLADRFTLDEYKIRRESNIHMLVNMCAGKPETLSIYIPSVYGNITKKDIANTFHRMNIGKVCYVDLVPQNRADGKSPQNRAFVYFDTIYDTMEANNMKYDLSTNQSVKMHYGKTPHIFWVLVKNKGKPMKDLPMEDYSDEISEISYAESVIRPMTMDELDVSSIDEVAKNLDMDFENVEDFEEDYSLVSADYANQLEFELYNARCQYAQLYTNFQQFITAHQ